MTWWQRGLAGAMLVLAPDLESLVLGSTIIFLLEAQAWPDLL